MPDPTDLITVTLPAWLAAILALYALVALLTMVGDMCVALAEVWALLRRHPVLARRRGRDSDEGGPERQGGHDFNRAA